MGNFHVSDYFIAIPYSEVQLKVSLVNTVENTKNLDVQGFKIINQSLWLLFIVMEFLHIFIVVYNVPIFGVAKSGVILDTDISVGIARYGKSPYPNINKFMFTIK